MIAAIAWDAQLDVLDAAQHYFVQDAIKATSWIIRTFARLVKAPVSVAQPQLA
jgi:hypothetical protein